MSNEVGNIVKDKSQLTVNTYLFTWSSKQWEWDMVEEISEIERMGKTIMRWSCGNTKSIKPNDRAFLFKLGSEPKGIIGSGVVLTFPKLDKHWNNEAGKETNYVEIEFDILLNPETEQIVNIDTLRESGLGEQNWTPQASGISIKPELVSKLEEVWFNFLTTQNGKTSFFVPIINNDVHEVYYEGNPNEIKQTRYERNPYARLKCLEHYGYSCFVCRFNFLNSYGEIGNNFIHVHHLISVATIGKTYQINPIEDLRPVCPNCHAMLHKKNPPLTIDELKSKLKIK